MISITPKPQLQITTLPTDLGRAQRGRHTQVEAAQGRRWRPHRVLPGGQAGHGDRLLGALRAL